jgi:Tol biopolymer transport system component
VLGDEAEYGPPELSPGGGRAAVSVKDPVNGTRDIWVFDLARGLRTRLTSGEKDVRGGLAWSPDASRIAFRSVRSGGFDVYQMASSGVGEEQPLWKDRLSKYPTSWSSDGRFILYSTGASTPGTGNDLWVLPLFGDRKPLPFLQTTFSESQGAFSPDGRRWYTTRMNPDDPSITCGFPWSRPQVANFCSRRSKSTMEEGRRDSLPCSRQKNHVG